MLFEGKTQVEYVGFSIHSDVSYDLHIVGWNNLLLASASEFWSSICILYGLYRTLLQREQKHNMSFNSIFTIKLHSHRFILNLI